LWPVGDPASEYVYNHFLEKFPNDPEFIDLLAGAKERIAGLPQKKVVIAGMSIKEKESLVTQFVTRLFGNRSSISKRVVASLPDNDPKFLDWGAELAKRFYEQGGK
jgi:hypothetical protein